LSLLSSSALLVPLAAAAAAAALLHSYSLIVVSLVVDVDVDVLLLLLAYDDGTVRRSGGVPSCDPPVCEKELKSRR